MLPNSVIQGQKYAVPLELGDVDPLGTAGPGGANTFSTPPASSPTDTRATRDVHTHPHIQFYDPNSLRFADAQGPIVRGSGGYYPVSPISMVVHDGQPLWNRDMISSAGPVREFFRRILFDNRTKHL